MFLCVILNKTKSRVLVTYCCSCSSLYGSRDSQHRADGVVYCNSWHRDVRRRRQLVWPPHAEDAWLLRSPQESAGGISWPALPADRLHCQSWLSSSRTDNVVQRCSSRGNSVSLVQTFNHHFQLQTTSALLVAVSLSLAARWTSG